MSRGEVVVVGSVAYDAIETPAEARDEVLGGSATYFSIAAARFATPRLVAVVGQDFASGDRDLLAARGVDLAGLEVAAGACFRWKGRYLADFAVRETIYTHLNVFQEFRPALPQAWRRADTLFLANIHPDLQHAVLDQMAGPGLVVADTMNLWIDTALSSLTRLLPRVDVLVINDEEARMLAGERSLPRAIRAVAAMGPRALVVKKGEHGAVLAAAGTDGLDLFFVPAWPLEDVVDPTGAGDSFAGGFVGCLAALGRRPGAADLRRAMLVGTVTASFAVEGFGVEGLLAVTDAVWRERLACFHGMLSLEEGSHARA